MSIIEKLDKIQQSVIVYQVNPQEELRLKLELKIDKLSRRILAEPDLADRNDLLSQLRLARTHLVTNQSQDPLRNLELNLVQNIPPSPLCPAYAMLEVPTVSTYHLIATNIASVRFDRQALTHVPELIKHALGDLSEGPVDLFYTTIDGRFMQNEHAIYGGTKPMNLCLHRWAHNEALPGYDVKANTDMGLFPVMGITSIDPSKDKGAIPFGSLKKLNIHSHPRGKPHTAERMLYSPNNAHFRLIPNSPFALFWSAAKLNGRTCIAKMLVIFDDTDPICRNILGSIQGTQTLNHHLEKLQGVSDAIDDIFDPLIHAFEAGEAANPMGRFYALPQMYQAGIYHQTWKESGSPLDIHPDFGRDSFLEDSLYTHAQRALIVTQYKESLKEALVLSHSEMLAHSLPLARSDAAQTLMKCARAFQRSAEEGLTLYQTFPKPMKDATHRAFWELSGCPRIDSFGTKNFPGSPTPVKVQALLLAASRQGNVPTSLPPSHMEELHVLQPLATDNGASSSSTPAGPSQPSPSYSIDAIFNRLIDLSGRSDFLGKSLADRSKIVRDALKKLPGSFRNEVYKHYYFGYKAKYPTEHIGGHNWGGENIGKDMEVCIEAFIKAQDHA